MYKNNPQIQPIRTLY